MINDRKTFLCSLVGCIPSWRTAYSDPCVTLIFSRALEIFWEMHVFISMQKLLYNSLGSWPSWYLSGSKDTHRGWGMKQRFFLGISCVLCHSYISAKDSWGFVWRSDLQEKGFVNPKSLFSFRDWYMCEFCGKWWWNEVIKGVTLNLTACVWILVSFYELLCSCENYSTSLTQCPLL